MKQKKTSLFIVEEKVVVIHRGRCNNKVYYRLSHDVVTWDVDRDVSTTCQASSAQGMKSTDGTASFKLQRSAVIGAFRSSHCSIVPASSCTLSGAVLYRSPVVEYFDRGHRCFRNFNSIIAVDVIRVRSYLDSFLDPTCVPVRMMMICPLASAGE